jgi:hypothetical protein
MAFTGPSLIFVRNGHPIEIRLDVFVDLSFARLDRDFAVTAMPTELAVLLVGVAARQASSPTARAQSRLDLVTPAEALLAPLHASFHRAVAAALRSWQRE